MKLISRLLVPILSLSLLTQPSFAKVYSINLSSDFIPPALIGAKNLNKYKIKEAGSRLISLGLFYKYNSEGLLAAYNLHQQNQSENNKKILENKIEEFNAFLEDRLFYSTYVLNQEELNKLKQETKKQLGIDTLEGLIEFINKEPAEITVDLDIPEQYQVNSMQLRIEIEKGKTSRAKFRLYQIINDGDILITEQDAITGGR